MSAFGGKAENIFSLSFSGFDPGRTSSNQQEKLEPRSVRNSLRRLGQAVGKELSHARPVMLGKYLGHQFAPTTDPDLVKDRLHIP